jgi:hypothetical protein
MSRRLLQLFKIDLRGGLIFTRKFPQIDAVFSFEASGNWIGE